MSDECDFDDPAFTAAYRKHRRKLFEMLCMKAWDNPELSSTQKIGEIALGIDATHDVAADAARVDMGKRKKR